MGHAPLRLPRRADPGGDGLRGELRRGQAREGDPDRRGRARGADLRALGKVPGPEVLVADEGQAGLLRGAARGRGPGGRWDRQLVRGASRPRRGSSCRRSSRPPPPARPRARPASSPAARVGAGHLVVARQARRLPGTRPGQVGDFPGRGRFRRRLGQAGPQPREPGGAAVARQDPERRARPLRQDAGVRPDRHADHGARRRHRPRRLRHREDTLSPHRRDDRRRRRRRPHQDAAADLLLPADAAGDRARLSLYRPAAAL